MKKTYLLGAIALLIIGCNEVTVDFTYSPDAPKAGEKITFTNNSSAGEDWLWDFGDNGISLLKSPTKIYKKPGTYIVTLQVDSSTNKMCSKSITVYDTIPTFVASTDSITHMTDVTLTANIYNPYSYTLTYKWTLPDGCELVDGELTDNAVTVYFDHYGDSSTVNLVITQGSKTFDITRSLYIYNTLSPSVLFSTFQGNNYRQRLVNSRFEAENNQLSSADITLLQNANDTIVTFNSRTFYASQMRDVIGVDVLHMAIDAMAQKWYYISANGLFVANIDGSYPQLIDEDACDAVCVDHAHNLLYWADANGLQTMALVKSSHNQFVTIPQPINAITSINKITINSSLQ